MDKIELRKSLLQNRKELNLNDRLIKNLLIKKEVLKLSSEYNWISIYISLDDEVDTKEIIKNLWTSGKHVCVPRCNKNTLTFHEIKSFKDLEPNVFNLLEPTTEAVDLNRIEIFFIPLLGFDTHNNRLGYGKGYYDSVLCKTNAYKVGLAYDIQEIDLVPTDEHDIVLNKIISK